MFCDVTHFLHFNLMYCIAFRILSSIFTTALAISHLSVQTIKGTLKLHQVSNKVSLKSGIYIRNFVCTCIPCLDHEFQLCQSEIYPAPEIFSSIAYMSKETNFKEISFQWYSFKSNSKSNTDESDACKDKEDALDKNEDEENTMMYGDIVEKCCKLEK